MIKIKVYIGNEIIKIKISDEIILDLKRVAGLDVEDELSRIIMDEIKKALTNNL